MFELLSCKSWTIINMLWFLLLRSKVLLLFSILYHWLCLHAQNIQKYIKIEIKILILIKYYSPFDQESGLFFWACSFSSSLANCWLVGVCTRHRADCNHRRGCVLKMCVKNVGTYTVRLKNAPKPWIISAYPTCLFQKMLHQIIVT